MSIRIRRVNGVTVALCAARSVEKPGDIYLDDNQHAALAEKFRRDFESEGFNVKPLYDEETKAAEIEEYMALCGMCGHYMGEFNRHGFDQNDGEMDEAGRLVHSGRCTYCRVCRGSPDAASGVRDEVLIEADLARIETTLARPLEKWPGVHYAYGEVLVAGRRLLAEVRRLRRMWAEAPPPEPSAPEHMHAGGLRCVGPVSDTPFGERCAGYVPTEPSAAGPHACAKCGVHWSECQCREPEPSAASGEKGVSLSDLPFACLRCGAPVADGTKPCARCTEASGERAYRLCDYCDGTTSYAADDSWHLPNCNRPKGTGASVGSVEARTLAGNIADEWLWRKRCEKAEAEAASLREENERLRVSMVGHFQRDHLGGDGPEIDRWKRRLAKAESELSALRQQFGNLLARIHRDGGHYITEHGWDKAAADAEAQVVRWLGSVEPIAKRSIPWSRRGWGP